MLIYFTQQIQEKGDGKNAQNGCNIATMKKVLNQPLKPVILYAADNGAINKIPSFDIPKQKTNTKRIVKETSVKLATIYNQLTNKKV